MSAAKELRALLENNPDLGVRDPSVMSWLKPRKRNAAASTMPRREDTELEATFAQTWRLLGGPELLRDHVFAHDISGMEIDFYHAESKCGVEIQGGLGEKSTQIHGTWYVPVGGHSSWDGALRDGRKAILALSRGIIIIPVCKPMLSPKEKVKTCEDIMLCMMNRRWRK